MEKRLSYAKYLGAAATVAFLVFIAYIAIRGEMFVLWPNITTVVCVAIVAAILGFIIYGWKKGFENTFPND